MKKALFAALALTLVAGCSMFDLDGNGRIDPVAYLENSNITFGWVGEDGQVYNVALDELGKQVVGNFIQAKTGYKFEIVEEGGLTITDPEGFKIQIARKQ